MKQVNGYTFRRWFQITGLASPFWEEEGEELNAAWEAGIDPYSYVTAKPRPITEDTEDTEEITWFWSNAEERVATPFDDSLVGKVGLQTDLKQKFKLLPGGKWVMVFE